MFRETRDQVYEVIRSVAALAGWVCEKPPHPRGGGWFTWSHPHDAFLRDTWSAPRMRLGLRLRDLTMLMIDENVREVPLRGAASLAAAIDVEALGTIARMYRDAAGVFIRKQRWSLEGSGVALDPHRCNLVMWDELTRAGFLAGDDAISEPYWYVVTPSVKRPFPPLPSGEWVEGEETLAVLKGDPDAATIEAFLDAALAYRY